MVFIKAILISTLAAVGGSLIATALLTGTVRNWQIAILPFGLLGSLLLATIYARVTDAGYSRVAAYLIILTISPIVGGLILAPSMAVETALIGAVYGAAIAVTWVAVHRLSSIREGRAST